MNANEANKLRTHYPKMVTVDGCIATWSHKNCLEVRTILSVDSKIARKKAIKKSYFRLKRSYLERKCDSGVIYPHCKGQTRSVPCFTWKNKDKKKTCSHIWHSKLVHLSALKKLRNALIAGIKRLLCYYCWWISNNIFYLFTKKKIVVTLQNIQIRIQLKAFLDSAPYHLTTTSK